MSSPNINGFHSSHYAELCQYGQIHAQCRCPSSNKTITTIVCDRPSQHASFNVPGVTGMITADPGMMTSPVSIEEQRETVRELSRLREENESMKKAMQTQYAHSQGMSSQLDLLRASLSQEWEIAGLTPRTTFHNRQDATGYALEKGYDRLRYRQVTAWRGYPLEGSNEEVPNLDPGDPGGTNDGRSMLDDPDSAAI